MKDNFLRIALAIFVLIAIGYDEAHAAMPPCETCPAFPPVTTLVLVEIYKDARQSVPDVDAEKKNGEMTAKVDNFLRYSEQALDNPNASPSDARAACAYQNFKQWASGGALTVEPKAYNRDGKVKRGEYVIGFNTLALKFKTAHFALDKDIIQWLHTMNYENMEFYEHSSNRGNLRIWSGAAAALYAVLDRDPMSLDYQDRVWHEAMAAIHDNGTIDGEMGRGQRALIYHMFSFSATLVLRSAREALDYSESPQDHTRLALLANMIGHTLCSPHDIESAAQAVQEIPGDWGYRIPIGFGADLLNEDWSRCGRPHAALSDPTSGGDTRHSAEILKRLAKQAH